MSKNLAGRRTAPQDRILNFDRAPAAVHISPDRLSETIGSIYDCVLDPGNWEPTLASINRELAFSSSVLGVVPLRAGGNVVNVSVGLDRDWLELAPDETYRSEAVALWGGAESMERFPLDEPIVGSERAEYAGRHANRYFCEVLQPRGLIDAIMLPVAREPGLVGYAAFNRHRSAGHVGEAEVGTLRLLGPHFRRAVTISNLFDLKAVEARTFVSALDAMASGVVLVDRALGVVHANAAAEAMLSEADPIRSVEGVLALPDNAANDALLAAVERAAHSELALGQRGIGIPADRKSGASAVVHVLPLHRSELRSGVAQRAAAVLFVVTAAAPPRMPFDALALIYDLTPAESRVFELICGGKTQAEIAGELGVARGTIKTHLLRTFQKTGCARQVDLLRLAAGLSSPA